MKTSRQASRHQREYDQARVAPQFRRISEIVEPSIKRICEKFGFPEIRIIKDWSWIAGPDLARRCYPVRIQKRRDSRVLVICAHRALATEVAHRTQTLLDRIATVCGYRAVDLIRVTQLGDVKFDMSPESSSASQPKQPAKPKSPSAATGSSIAAFDEPCLREALASLAASLQLDETESTPDSL